MCLWDEKGYVGLRGGSVRVRISSVRVGYYNFKVRWSSEEKGTHTHTVMTASLRAVVPPFHQLIMAEGRDPHAWHTNSYSLPALRLPLPLRILTFIGWTVGGEKTHVVEYQNGGLSSVCDSSLSDILFECCTGHYDADLHTWWEYSELPNSLIMNVWNSLAFPLDACEIFEWQN